MRDLNDFAARLKRISESLEPNVDKLMKDVAIAVAKEVVAGTPVLTSRARANWQTSLNEAAQGVLYPQPQKPPTPESGAERSLAEARDVLSEYKTGDTVYIQNNLPYIGALNRGHSRQAPAMFVERAAMRGRALIKGAAGRIFITVKKG
jgi:hypothetical protein